MWPMCIWYQRSQGLLYFIWLYWTPLFLAYLPEFSSSTWRHWQRVRSSDILLCQRWQISSPSLTTAKICCLYRRIYSWYLPLSRDDWISNHIDHFRSELSSFWPFIFQQQSCRNSPAIYWSSLHEKEKYLWILWKNWTQSLCLNHLWSKIPPTKS